MSNQDDALMKPEEVAALLNVRPQTLSNWRHFDKGPGFIRSSGFIRYRRSVVDAWLAENEVSHTGGN